MTEQEVADWLSAHSIETVRVESVAIDGWLYGKQVSTRTVVFALMICLVGTNGCFLRPKRPKITKPVRTSEWVFEEKQVEDQFRVQLRGTCRRCREREETR